MGQPRASRRKVIAASSDEEDLPRRSSAGQSQPRALEKEEKTPPNGKLKSVAKSAGRGRQDTSTSTRISGTISPKATKTGAKSKPQQAKHPQQSSRPIFSFFNAATQKQRSPEQASVTSNREPSPVEPEGIVDSDDDDIVGPVEISNGSSTALAHRKRKLHSQAFDNDPAHTPPRGQKFRKTGDGRSAASLAVFNEDSRPWTEQFAPVDLTELAVHKKKVSDVRQWLESVMRGRRQKVLVLKGAAGTGKTTTVRLLAKDLDLSIVEWQNPAGPEYASEGSSSAMSPFEDFIGRASKVPGLSFSDGSGAITVSRPESQSYSTNNEQKQLLLIEEFPNTYSRTSAALRSFRTSLIRYISSPIMGNASPTPVVMVLSETLLSTNTAAADSFTANRLLGAEILSHPGLDVIEFNPIAPTILTKALGEIVVKEARKSGRRKTPGVQVIKHLAESGDIRSAVSALEFLCLRGDDEDTWSSRVTFSKTKKAKFEPTMTTSEEEALKIIGNRESTLGIFHAVGKIVYNKRAELPGNAVLVKPPDHLAQHWRARPPENDVDELMDGLGTDVSTFLAALHENYVLSCASPRGEETANSLSGCIDILSDADLLSLERLGTGTRAFSASATDGLRQDELSYQVAARGLLFMLPHPVHRAMPPSGNKADAHKMFYPASMRMWRSREEIDGLLDLLTTKAQSGTLNSISLQGGKPAGATPAGVESWATRKIAADTSLQTTEKDDRADSSMPTPTAAKAQMVMERLPYMSLILASRPSRLLEQIHKVSRIRGWFGPADEDDANDESDIIGATAADSWATDRPDGDMDGPKTRKRQGKGKQKVVTEGGGLHIPVESEVARLVLEDDDIVDE